MMQLKISSVHIHKNIKTEVFSDKEMTHLNKIMEMGLSHACILGS